MQVISDVTDPDERKHTMTEKKGKAGDIDVKALLAGDDAFIRTVVRAALQEVLEAEMTEPVPRRCPITGWADCLVVRGECRRGWFLAPPNDSVRAPIEHRSCSRQCSRRSQGERRT